VVDARPEFASILDVLSQHRVSFIVLGQQQLITRFGPLDVLGTIGNQRTYDDFRSRTVELPLRGRVVRVLELAAVIESKEEANRPKDRAVLPLLRDTLAARRRRGE
jgi:hypothetical protein